MSRCRSIRSFHFDLGADPDVKLQDHVFWLASGLQAIYLHTHDVENTVKFGTLARARLHRLRSLFNIRSVDAAGLAILIGNSPNLINLDFHENRLKRPSLVASALAALRAPLDPKTRLPRNGLLSLTSRSIAGGVPAAILHHLPTCAPHLTVLSLACQTLTEDYDLHRLVKGLPALEVLHFTDLISTDSFTPSERLKGNIDDILEVRQNPLAPLSTDSCAYICHDAALSKFAKPRNLAHQRFPQVLPASGGEEVHTPACRGQHRIQRPARLSEPLRFMSGRLGEGTARFRVRLGQACPLDLGCVGCSVRTDPGFRPQRLGE